MRVGKFLFILSITILFGLSIFQKSAFSFYGKKVFLKNGKSTIYLYKGSSARLYFDYSIIDIKLHNMDDNSAIIKFIAENKNVKLLPDKFTPVLIKKSPRIIYLKYLKSKRRKYRRYSSIYLEIKLGGKNKAFKSDQLMMKRVKIANYLAKILINGGDRLNYSTKMLRYLSREHNVGPTIEGYHKRYNRRRWRRRSRRGSIDLYSLLSGGLAIRESLQTETIRPVENADENIPINSLTAPTVKSHPFQKMLEGRKYKFFSLAKVSPFDFYYVHFNNMKKALEFFDYLNEVGGSIYQKYSPKSVDFKVKQKVLRQLAIKENKWARKFYSTVIGEMAIVGSDPFVMNGTDVTFMFKLKSKLVFKIRINSYRKDFLKEYKAKSINLKINGIKANLIKTKDRKINSYYFFLPDGTAVISNSLEASKIIISTYRKKRKALSGEYDFQYMRSIYKASKKNEDAFLYMSDPFIRRLIGPEIRIKEARRMREALLMSSLDLRLIYYKQLYGKRARSFKDLSKEFSVKDLKRFKGILIRKDAIGSLSKRYGRIGYMLPNIEMKAEMISKNEERSYKAFIRGYNRFWRDYFDPIGVRIKFGKKMKVETCILPLINNSIYNNLTRFVGGESIKINTGNDLIPGEIFSMYVKLNKKWFDMAIKKSGKRKMRNDLSEYLNIINTIGDHIQVHVLDSEPLVDFDSSDIMSNILGRRPRMRNVFAALLAWSIFHPIRITLPLKDTEGFKKILANYEKNYFRKGRYRISRDFEISKYRFKYKNNKVNVLKLNLFNILKFRFFYTVNNNSFIVTTTKGYMVKILNQSSGKTGRVKAPSIFPYKIPLDEDYSKSKNERSNIMVVYRPGQLNFERDVFIFNMIENSRDASLKNLATYKLFRDILGKSNIDKKSYNSFGFQIKCPAGGRYLIDKKTGEVYNSVFGNKRKANLDVAKIGRKIPIYRFLSTKGIMINLEFTPEGIKSIIEIE